MRFSLRRVDDDPTFYGPLARAAEDAGYDTFVVPDSIAYPARVRHHLPLQTPTGPGVPRGQALHRAFSLIPARGQ